ncbi:hypothetical protein BHE74_00041863 [Ensete ventricosum]|nr:hypothetical protein BHE74_00041863 [Ensete ventricosum]
MGSRTSMIFQKNAMVIIFAQRRARSRVSIGFLRFISEIQHTGHSQRISPSDVVLVRFHEKK